MTRGDILTPADKRLGHNRLTATTGCLVGPVMALNYISCVSACLGRSPGALTCAKLGGFCASSSCNRAVYLQLGPALRRGAFFVAIDRPALPANPFAAAASRRGGGVVCCRNRSWQENRWRRWRRSGGRKLFINKSSEDCVKWPEIRIARCGKRYMSMLQRVDMFRTISADQLGKMTCPGNNPPDLTQRT
jgi:hypothetical protein